MNLIIGVVNWSHIKQNIHKALTVQCLIMHDSCNVKTNFNFQILTQLIQQRHYFANKGPSSQGYGFSSSHVWMWELDYEESWVPKNWCFWTVVLEKTLESPMDCSTPGLPVHHQLPELTQTHVHQVSDAIQPSHPLSSPSPPAPNPSLHQSLFQWVNSSHEVAKVLEFQL